jgi:hypothetical protein
MIEKITAQASWRIFVTFVIDVGELIMHSF